MSIGSPKPLKVAVLALGILVAGSVARAEDMPTPAESPSPLGTAFSLDSVLPGFSIARCMFPQGRLVLEKGEELVVLREGDRLPGPEGFRVLEISDSRAVLARSAVGVPAIGKSAAATVMVPETLILIEVGPEGTTTVTVGTARAVQEPLPPLDDSQALITLSPEGSRAVTPGELRSLEPPSAPMHRIVEPGSGGAGSGEGGGQ